MPLLGGRGVRSDREHMGVGGTSDQRLIKCQAAQSSITLGHKDTSTGGNVVGVLVGGTPDQKSA